MYSDGIPDGNFDPYILDRNRAIDIDNHKDLELVRALMSYKNKLI
jgi:CMP-N-acetylneuraminic acid synthetase